jgi:tripartite-type tricarboxylate transporter receptor subunit TctC
VRFVVAYPPRGATDSQARLLAQLLGEAWNQTVVVENRAGGNTVIATELVAKAPADGHTLLFTALPFALNPFLYEQLPYDTARDLAPISLLSTIPNVLVVHPSVPATSVGELVAYARSRPGQLSYASAGVGTASHLAGELLNAAAGLDLVHVPYRGSGPATADVLSGRVPIMFDTAMKPHIEAGRVRALAVTTSNSSALYPGLPTISDSGYPGFGAYAWYLLAAPGGTPAPIVEAISARTSEILRRPEVRERLLTLTAEPVAATPEETRRFVAAEGEKWGRLIRERGIRPDS